MASPQQKATYGTYVFPAGFSSATYHDMESQQPTERGWPETQADLPCSELPEEIRTGFIRKVLVILTLQVLTTLACATLFMLSPNVRVQVLSTRWPLYTAIFAPIGFLLALGCYQRSHPTNLILLSGFTLAESYTVGFLCAATYAAGYGAIIWQALLITAAVFVSLVTFVLVTRRDFSQHGLLLFGLLFVLIIAGIFVPFLGATAHLVYACAGALLFTGLVLYDVSLLVHRFGPDDYIMAAIALCVWLDMRVAARWPLGVWRMRTFACMPYLPAVMSSLLCLTRAGTSMSSTSSCSCSRFCGCSVAAIESEPRQ
jgi:FtsH-binding integral membrane protein